MIHFKRVPTHVSPMNTLKQKLGLSLQVAKGHVTHPHIFFFFSCHMASGPLPVWLSPVTEVTAHFLELLCDRERTWALEDGGG